MYIFRVGKASFVVIFYLVFLSNFLPSSTMFLVIVVCTHFDHFADICGHPAARSRHPRASPVFPA